MTFFEVLEKHGWLEEYERNIQTAIQSAILAEREECALMAQHWGAMMNDADPRETLSAAEFSRRYGHDDLPDAIRARSQSAPQSSNPAHGDRFQTEADLLDGLFEKKPPDTPPSENKALESTFPGSLDPFAFLKK